MNPCILRMWGFVLFKKAKPEKVMHSKFMNAALSEARLAAKCGEVPVGAVVVKNGEIISAAHNLCEDGCCALKHAEMLALDKAMGVLGDSRLDGCDLYVTLEPCVMCCGAISHARIRRLYFGAYDKIGGGVVSNLHLFNPPSPLRSVEYYCGIMEAECSKLLTEFFKKLRSDIAST